MLLGLGPLLFQSQTATAQSCSEKLLKEMTPEALKVEQVSSGGILKLAGGTELKLAGILLPQRPLDGRVKDAAKRHDMALSALKSLTKDAEIRRARNPPQDRHGREMAQIVVGSGLWLQAELVKQGLARVEPEVPGNACSERLLKVEAEARAGKAGLWGEADFQVKQAWATRKLLRLENTFQIVEGKVAKVAETKRFTYINFGKDWRTDFTASISSRTLRRLKKSGFKATQLQGRKVRIRGWITYRNGPMIEITQAAQIERVEK